MNTAQLQGLLHYRYTTRAPFLSLHAKEATAVLNGSNSWHAQPIAPSFHAIVQNTGIQLLHYTPASQLARIRRCY
jgi:hypothetical protein